MPVIAHIGSGLTVGGGLLAVVAVYAFGVKRIWDRGGVGAGVRVRDVTAFGFGVVVLAVALVGPVEELAEQLFSVHMTQHVLLTLVAAPLLVASRPLLPFSRAFPPGGRRRLGGMERAVGGRKRDRRPLFILGGAYLAVFWLWHVPSVYETAVRVEALHAIQHVSLLVVALGLWWSVENGVRRAVVGPTIAVLAVIFLQGAWSGALLSFHDRLIYRSFIDTAPALGIDPLSDQQSGFAIMMASGIVYVGAMVATAGRALARLEQASSWRSTSRTHAAAERERKGPDESPLA